ncbi:uncharacterized protein TNCV_5010711 [Trichonephila clavipes]|nr:uncharacterized protein TNCV_5010711 [Trichonephila clavipes]
MQTLVLDPKPDLTLSHSGFGPPKTLGFFAMRGVTGVYVMPLMTAQLSNDENADFIILNNKLSIVKEIIEEISQLKCAYYNLPDDTDLKDALDVTIDLQAETKELEANRDSCPSETFSKNSLEKSYGTTLACYISTRVLKQLSLDERENFPKAADIVLHDVYLDDILSGCSSLNELESLKTELTRLFKSAGMSLHKWFFSHSTNDFPDLHFDQSSEESITKTLGGLWNSSPDTPFVLKFLIISLRREMCSPRSHVFSTHLVS